LVSHAGRPRALCAADRRVPLDRVPGLIRNRFPLISGWLFPLAAGLAGPEPPET
jgi:hypothetical protein